jgi:hypothetical protein
MVLGDDIGLEDSVSLSLCALVGRITYKHLCHTDLAIWLQSHWRPLLGYTLVISYLTHGWLCFRFNMPEDTNTILERFWILDGGSLMLKRWRPNFNPLQDYFQLRHFWVLLPGLPLHFWNLKALEAIEQYSGSIHLCGQSVSHWSEQKLEKVMVEIDIHEGCLETIDIEWRGQLICQNLDYLRHPLQVHSL